MKDVTKGQALSAMLEAPINELGRFTDSIHGIVANDILPERLRQNLKFTRDVLGAQHHSAIAWGGILCEEAGETQTEANGASFGASEESLRKMRMEAVQTAAVAVAIIQAIDSGDSALLAPEITQRG